MATANVQVEHYRRPDVDVPPHQVSAIDRLVGAYQQAGMRALASSMPDYADATSRLESADLLYGRLSPEDLALWGEFLPTSYPSNHYQYDIPPEEVARAIADAQTLGVFDRIEIWTPEGSGIWERTRQFYHRVTQDVHQQLIEIAADSMAVGVIQRGQTTVYYPIVRWGESLQSFARITAMVRLRSATVFAMTKLPLMLLGLVVLGLLVWGFVASWAAIGAWAIAAWLLAAIAVAVFTSPAWA